MMSTKREWFCLFLRGLLGGTSGALFALSAIFWIEPELDSEMSILAVVFAGGMGSVVWKISQVFRLRSLCGLFVVAVLVVFMSFMGAITGFSQPTVFNVWAFLGIILGLGGLITVDLWVKQQKSLLRKIEKHRGVVMALGCFGVVAVAASYLVSVDKIVLLDKASRQCDYEEARHLLETKFDANVHHYFLGETPLHEAAYYGCIPIMTLLLERGADVTARDTSTGETPLHKAMYWGRSRAIEVLLTYGADVNVQEHNGDTPLHRASQVCCVTGDTVSIELLLAHGANVNVRNNQGKTPLEGVLATEEHCDLSHQQNVVRVLHQYGAKQ